MTPNSPQGAMTAELARIRSTEKYQRILAAAIEVIAEHGYFQSRVSAIADRAGVADGTIYLYFKNKEEILRAAIDAAFAGFLERAKQEVASVATPAEKLRHLGELHLSMLGANRPMAVVFQTELRHSSKFLADFSRHQLKEYFDLIRAIVREGQAQGSFRSDVSEKIFANCFFGALDEMVTSWVLSEKEYPLAQVAEPVVDVILKGLQVTA